MTDEEFKQQLLDPTLIAKIVKSRRKSSANGPDGIGYRIMRLGGKKATEFLQTLFSAIWENHRVPANWKQAKTVLLHKKGAEEVITNWRPISLTNAIYRIFTATVAHVIQERNINGKDPQSHTKRIHSEVQRMHTEHSIMINELFNDADDIILIAENQSSMERLVQTTGRFL